MSDKSGDSFILQMDRQQADETHAKRCPKDPKHGKLQVHGSGSLLVCTVKDCSHAQQLDRKDLLDEFKQSTFIPVGDIERQVITEDSVGEMPKEVTDSFR